MADADQTEQRDSECMDHAARCCHRHLVLQTGEVGPPLLVRKCPNAWGLLLRINVLKPGGLTIKVPKGVACPVPRVSLAQ